MHPVTTYLTVDQLPPPPPGKTGWPWTVGAPPVAPTRPGGSAWPTISVITPSFNQAAYLEETLRSVLLQGYPALEYIVLDGGSGDGSVDIIRRYAPWLAHWSSAADSGQADAIARGVARSRGVFVAWQNSDDTYLPGALAALAVETDSADIVYADCHWTDAASRVIGRFHSEPFTLPTYLMRHIVPNQAALVRRSAWDAVGGINRDLRFAMEEDLWLKLGLRHTFRRVDGVWATYRLFADSKSGGQTAAFYREHLAVLDAFFARDDLPPELPPLREAVVARAHLIGACRLYTAERSAEAGDALVAALRANPAYAGNDARATALTLAGWSRFPVVPDAVAFLEGVLAALPDAAAPIRPHLRRVLGDVAVERLFAAYQRRDRAAMRRLFAAAARYRPLSLANRGVLKVGWLAWAAPADRFHA